MDLIYADLVEGMLVDRGVLNNYEFDLSFGESENDFKLSAPMSGTRLYENQIIYMSGTEYGGIIDAIEVDTETQMLIYTGRTWHGILENKILYPPTGYDFMFVNGDANEVLAELLERMNIIEGENNELYNKPIFPIIRASEEVSGIEVFGRITSDSGNYATGYTFIRDLLYTFGAKPKIVDGVISAVPYADYSNDDDFLADTDQFRAKRAFNSLNRLHCMGQGDLRDRYVIDLYLDANGGLLPYSRSNPTEDSHYYTDIAALEDSTNPEDIANFNILKAQMLTGANEISAIYDYPNASTTYHYVPQSTQPDDWGSDLAPEITDLNSKEKIYGFEQYFYQDPEEDGKYVSVSKPALDTGYELQLSMPADWMSDFDDYYEKTSDGWTKVASITAYDPVYNKPQGWEGGAYSNYYKLVNGNYSKVGLVQGLIKTDVKPPDWDSNWSGYATADGARVKGVTPPLQGTPLTKQPADWKTNFSNYYTSDGVNFNKVNGVPYDAYELTTYQPSDWNSAYNSYYTKNKAGKYVALTKKKKWKAGTFWKKNQKTKAPKFKANPRVIYYTVYQPPDVAPNWVPDTYYVNGYVVPEWGSFQAYEKRNYPTWMANKYYTAYTYQPIPTWTEDMYYTEYPDHYEALVEAAKKKIESYMVKDSLSIKLDEKRVYDINDRVGASDEVTGIGAIERITQKIVKIKRGITSFEYKTGV